MRKTWFLHNLASYVGIGGDTAKHVDIGPTIFADGDSHPLIDEDGNISATGVMSVIMRGSFIVFGNPIAWIGDLIENGGFVGCSRK